MRSSIAVVLFAPVFILFPLACGGSSAASGEYADKCEIACKPPAGPCGTQDPGDCQQACVTATEGLVVECAQCIAEHSGWHGQQCTCSGGMCSLDSFGSDSTTEGTGPSDPSFMCDPVAETKCLGFEIESITASACKTFCVAK